MHTATTYPPRKRGSRVAAAAAAAFVSLGLLSGVASSFHGSKALQLAKADSHRLMATASQK